MMAEICCGIIKNDRSVRRRRMEIQRINLVDSYEKINRKRQRNETESFDLVNDVKECDTASNSGKNEVSCSRNPSLPDFGMLSVCGRRREMEDAYSIHPSFCGDDLHFFGVYDGHGCSHVASRCKERLHEIVKEEIQGGFDGDWEVALRRSFSRMEEEVVAWNEAEAEDADADAVGRNCKCGLRVPDCGAVGSTAVVAILSPEKIIVANCGDSRAVLSRNGRASPLSIDHKPDRPDELERIQNAGGRVIYWDGARVLGVLAMSRAIGDSYLKPYVSAEPEVTITARTPEDECVILASDGLWDVVSNDTACRVARMCLRDGACADASALLAKLALARRSSDNITAVVISLRNLDSGGRISS